MIPYVVLGGLGLMLMPLWNALALAAGFALAAVLDTLAARRGDAPAYFAGLRPAQLSIAALSLLAIALRLAR